MNTFGKNLRLTTFGESHGKAIGGILDGFPPGFKIDLKSLVETMEERKPGTSSFVSQRKEEDMPEFLSGITEEYVTLGTPIGFIIRNKDNRGKDYSNLADKYRPNHADYTYEKKYGIRDYLGGGRASARETANWVVAGALAQQWLSCHYKISIDARLTGVGDINYSSETINLLAYQPLSNTTLSLSNSAEIELNNEILKALKTGNSIGGTVTGLILNMPPGVGSPVFEKLHSKLALAMMSINAAKGFEYGIGFQASRKYGSEILDTFYANDSGKILTHTNFSGGIQGGISNGMPIYFNVAFKPTPTILREIETINSSHETITLKMTGRHDPCVAMRAVPVVKAMTALVIADFLLGTSFA